VLALISFLGSPLGRIVGIVGLVLFLLASGWGLLKMRDASIRREALDSFNRQQLEQVVKDQEAFMRQTRILQETQSRMIESLTKKVEEVDRRAADVEAYLNSAEAKKNDRPASNIFKETLSRLGAPK
jgi:hypothetical protein